MTFTCLICICQQKAKGGIDGYLCLRRANAAQLNVISAGILIIFIPTVAIFLSMQKFIFAGVTSGAVK